MLYPKTFVLAASLGFTTATHADWVRGVVFDEATGQPLVTAAVSLTRAPNGPTLNTTTGAGGVYSRQVPPGRYFVSARLPGYLDASSRPGTVLATPAMGPPVNRTGLKSRNGRTVILIRHADRDGAADELNAAGLARASDDLVQLARQAGVARIFATTTQRSRQTVQPLSDAISVAITEYNAGMPGVEQVVGLIRSTPALSVSVVAAHSDTVDAIAQQLGGNANACPIANNEFDAVCIVHASIATVRPFKLQYGRPSP